MSKTNLVERELQGHFLNIFHDIFKEENYKDFSISQEVANADLTITHKSKPLFFLELKDPLAKDGKSVENSDIFQRETQRAKRTKIPHFGITNFTNAIIHSLDFDTDLGEEQRENFEYRNFATLQDIERYRNSKNFSKDLSRKFQNLAKWYLGKAETILLKGKIEKQSPDEIFILKLQSGIEKFGFLLSEEVFERYGRSFEFKREIQTYFQSQQWSIPTEESDFDNFSHISILIFISKIIFYKAVKDFGKYDLDDFEISENREIESQVWKLFEHLKERTGDFELLIGNRESIENRVIFLKSDIAKSIIDEVLLNSEKYNFSKMKEDIIGRIFEELIKPDERHKLGQYFTSSEVTKVINSFCIRNSDDKVLDPSCGSGAFLTSVYERKRVLGNRNHEKLLEEIHGVDISSYPAFLSMLNLSIRDLSQKSYPRVIQKDFFAVANQVDSKTTSFEEIHDSDGKPLKIPFLNFDAIVGNPPYTRQEDIDSFNPKQKEVISQILVSELGDFVKHISKRTSIYAYFFYRAKRLLKEDGYLGFITSNSWLDVDFGETLQKFMTENFHVVAIIDSKVERFFESADVNTNITILRKLKSGEKRDELKTRFVYLKRKLSEVLTKFGGEEKLRDFIENQNELFENEFLRINPISQNEISKENKWSKFLKAPKIYWEILEKGKGKWKKLSEVAEVRRGFTTGVNEFFYLEDISDEQTQKGLKLLKNGVGENVLIEERFIKPVIKSPREIKGYIVKPENLKFSVLMVNGFERREIKEKFPYLERYLKMGEEKGYPDRSSLKSRRHWWELGEQKFSNLAFNYMIYEVGKSYFTDKTFIDNNFQVIYSDFSKNIFSFTNSTIFYLFQNVEIRSNFGGGVGKIQTYELENMLILNPILINQNLFLSFNNKETKSIFEELKLDYRKTLDKEILLSIGFKENEIERVLQELYEAVEDLVNSRLQKAKSVKKTAQKRKKVDIEALFSEFSKLISRKAEKSLNFFEHISDEVVKISPDKKIQKTLLSRFWKEKFSETLPTLAKLKKIEKEKQQGKLF
jgi:methylase of polypeptide subunit release factors